MPDTIKVEFGPAFTEDYFISLIKDADRWVEPYSDDAWSLDRLRGEICLRFKKRAQ